MLNENIKNLRKSKGLSQEELAIKLNVVRQTVSKWENGLSVPDSSMLISLADELDTSVSELLGEPITEPATDDLKTISEKLEVINLQLAKRSMARVKTVRWLLISLKIINVASGFIVRKKFVAEHTAMNKVTGLLLFFLPLTFSIMDVKYSVAAVCAVATFAAIQEGHIIRNHSKSAR